MKLKELIDKLSLEAITEIYYPDYDVTGAYTGDLLSDVIANSKRGNLWVTMQKHLNIIAVASLKEIPAIIIVMDKELDFDTLETAGKEKVTILRTDLNAYQISGRIYELGIR